MPNPYAAGPMVTDPGMFFGRQAVISTITTRLANNMQCTSVVGQRRIGKSSLLYQMARQLPQDGRLLPVYVDMHNARFHTVPGFFTNVLAALDEQAGRAFNFGTTASCTDFDQAVEQINRSGLSPVVLLDEFEEFVDHSDQFGDEFLKQLRAVAQASKLAFVTASQNSLGTLTKQNGLTSPFYNVFTQADLGLLEKDAARRLVREPMEREGIQVTFYLQMACGCVFDALQREAFEPELVRREFANQAEQHWAGLWGHLSRDERAALCWIAGKSRAAPQPVVLERLERKGVVERHGETWQIFSQAFARAMHEGRVLPGEDMSPSPSVLLAAAPQPTLDTSRSGPWITPPLYAYVLVGLASLIVSALVSLLLPPDKFWQAFVLLSAVLLFTLVGVGKLGGPDFVKWLGNVLKVWK
ncbi:MAG: AAA family ATPase [Thermoflexales bacterium]|nr:AAA family ATPase [Thermoflexales bacterium]